jgi:hypothetical protein
MIFGILGDDSERVALAQLGLHLVSHNGTTQTGTEDNNMSHNYSPFLKRSGPLWRSAWQRLKLWWYPISRICNEAY